nr:MAG TPA: antirepressor protein [Caudoviricetes sp.]
MNEVLTVIQETEILGKKIKVYNNIETPLFLASDVAEWIEHSQTSKMVKSVDDDEKLMGTLFLSGQNRDAWFLTEDGLYEVCMQSRKPIAKKMKKEIKRYLKSIRLTGAAIPHGREQEMVNYYFSSLSSDLQGKIVNELIEKNKELQTFYDDLMNTEGLMQMNTVAKELGIGEYTLFAYLRGKKVLFYDKDMVNVPYERFRKEGKFAVKETPCHDGKIRSVTYSTKNGLDYIRKLLRKDGYYDVPIVS